MKEEGTFSQYREQKMIVGPPGKRGKQWRYKTSYRRNCKVWINDWSMDQFTAVTFLHLYINGAAPYDHWCQFTAAAA